MPRTWTGTSEIRLSPIPSPTARRIPWPTLQKMNSPWDVNLAAAYARLGKLDEARANIAKLLEDKPGWTVQKEAAVPTTKQPQTSSRFSKPSLHISPSQACREN
ncbi:MAG TPA: hypothetical protein VK638_16780 [Edaphobacter sp.]|nr:hypothetical protein [Edaphobacter sp.]